MKRLYATADEMSRYFDFLLSIGFSICRKENLSHGAYVEYKGNGRRIYLGFDYKSYEFNFMLYNDENLAYSDAAYGSKIRSFCDLAKEYVSKDFDCKILQPNKIIGFETALHANSELLKNYGADLILGTTWFL